ncbi:hypothetical protein FO519_003412 [Halicephalobus sp. NKZ332]|nr:hypothetical protein FO519_003412 [Halicephalobus sp. NKZ332]
MTSDAECIIDNSYVYFGNKSTDREGRRCETWKNATEYHHNLFKEYSQYFFPEEYAEHSYCQNIILNLYERNGNFNNASAHHYVQTDGWMEGPWCYVEVENLEEKPTLWEKEKSNYVTSPCFPKCDTRGLETETIMEEPTEKPKKYQLYNEEILDRIGDLLSNSFDPGDNHHHNQPGCCKYCQLPAAFVDRLCVHCSYSRRKLGSPVPCSKCALRCAFAKDEKRAKTVLCRMCSMNMAPEEKVKHKRAAKASSSKQDHSPAKKLKSLPSSIKDSKQPNTSGGSDHLAQIQQLKDQIVELKSTVMQRDHTVMEKDKTIGTLRTELMVKEKEHLQSLQAINKRNESTVNALKEQMRDLTKQLDYSNQKARLR